MASQTYDILWEPFNPLYNMSRQSAHLFHHDSINLAGKSPNINASQAAGIFVNSAFSA